MNRSFIILISIALLAGCANAGNKAVDGLTQADVSKSLVQEKTTKNEVRNLFGSPMETTYTDGGLEIWKYEYVDASAMTAETVGSMLLTFGLAGTKTEGTKYELTILFNDNDTVKKFNMNDSEVQSGTGIF
jgi:outer membrane protein assembly factor BamE (lipoprotein component of BamABCDE complex)